jgi:hypothetical protein
MPCHEAERRQKSLPDPYEKGWMKTLFRSPRLFA